MDYTKRGQTPGMQGDGASGPKRAPTMVDFDVLYLHGFASSPTSAKAQVFARHFEALGARVAVPDLNEDDFEHLTISRMLACAQRADRELGAGRRRVVVGSSLGGYVAALHVHQGGPADALILLAPAFDPVSRWTAGAGSEGLEPWRRADVWHFEHHAYQTAMPLRYQFIEDAATHTPWPLPPAGVPVLILHGTRDAVVPLETSREFVRRVPTGHLVELDTDHEMKDALDALWPQAESFLSEVGALRGEERTIN